jgi:NAD+ kinase
VIDTSVQISVRKAGFMINLVRLNNESYLNTLRNKLLWGIDTRNY